MEKQHEMDVTNSNGSPRAWGLVPFYFFGSLSLPVKVN